MHRPPCQRQWRRKRKRLRGRKSAPYKVSAHACVHSHAVIILLALWLGGRSANATLREISSRFIAYIAATQSTASSTYFQALFLVIFRHPSAVCTAKHLGRYKGERCSLTGAGRTAVACVRKNSSVASSNRSVLSSRSVHQSSGPTHLCPR